jgi:hypothetical protein
MIMMDHTAHMVSSQKILCFTGAVSGSRNLFLTCSLVLDCQFGFPVDVIPEFMTILVLPSVTGYPTPFDQNSENSGKIAFSSNPIHMCGCRKTNCMRNVFQGLGIAFAIG